MVIFDALNMMMLDWTFFSFHKYQRVSALTGVLVADGDMLFFVCP